MNSKPVLTSADFKKIILEGVPIIDVRAPVEFLQGHIPGSINLPILSDVHRHEIGLVYKQQGQEAAIKRGHELVSGSVKESLIQSWVSAIEKNPQTLITCFRGGQRSQITQTWLSEAGLIRPRIDGGYKAFRQFLLDELLRLSARPMLVISGPTGSGKTKLIEAIKNKTAALNLEALANHRGSAFGGQSQPQPSQADYENQLTYELLHLEDKKQTGPLIVEDESRLIGRTAQPDRFFDQLRASELVYLEEPVEARVDVIFEEYILNLSASEKLLAFSRYEKALQMISKKLGGLRTQEISHDLQKAIQNDEDLTLHKVWIEKLLVWYYDPLYLSSFEKRKPTVIFRGTRKKAEEFLLK